MGAILKIKKATTFVEVLILAIVLGVGGYALYEIAPGLSVSESKQLDSMTQNTQTIDNVTRGDQISLPSTTPSTSVVKLP